MTAKSPKPTLVALKPLKTTEESQPETAQEVVERLAPKPLPIKKSPTPSDKPAAEAKGGTCEAQNSDAIFRAVGIIVGAVSFDENDRSKVIIAQKEYPLFYAGNHKQAYAALRKEILNTGQHQRLIVYPKIVHFPRKEQPHLVSFQLVGFDKDRYTEGVAKELGDFEFKFSGLWQFIPVCQIPCISVFKNFTTERLDRIKTCDAQQKVRFMKASHIPVFWKGAPVKPFRFNPKLDKEHQGHASFVEIKASFLPQTDVFAFKSLLAQPTTDAPKFLRAGKKDKAIALQVKSQRQR